MRKTVGVISAFLFLALFLSSTFSFPSALGSKGPPDSECAYVWMDSQPPPPSVGFSWIDIQSNGTRIVSPGNDAFHGPFTLGFTFTFYGNAYSDVFVGTNGYLSFGSGYSTIPGTGIIPSPGVPNNVVMGYGADLNPAAVGSPAGVYFQQLTAPNRFVVAFYDVPHFPSSNPVTFEMILYETGEIWFQYLSLTGSVRTVGIENANGTVGLSYGTALSNGLAIRLWPLGLSTDPVGVSLSPCSQTISGIPGGQVDANLTVTNTGTSANDTFELNFTSPSGWNGTFLHTDGVTPVTDTNNNSLPDTGLLAPSGGFLDIVLAIDVHPNASVSEVITVTATSALNASIFASVDVLVDFPATIVSPDANIIPAIDGVYSPGEWGDALVVDLSAIPGNGVPSLLLVKNDADFLYIAFDATGDKVGHPSDLALLLFDTGNDEVASNGDEDAFVQESIQSHFIWSVASAGYVLEDSPYAPSLPDHSGLASARGFGASDNDPTSHRVYEFSIPLPLIGAAPGDTLGFFGGFLDSGGSSFWPIPFAGPLPPLSDYGDLILDPGVVPEHDILVLGLQAPDFLRPGDTTLVGATIRNRGLNNETNVQVNFTVDGVVLANTTIPFLGNGTSTTVSFPWTPSVEANYTVCIEVQPVPDENVTTNNLRCKAVRVTLGLRVGIYNHGTTGDISYWIGGNGNYYTTFQGILDSDPLGRFLTVIITDLSSSTLSDLDVLLLPDNAVPDIYLAEVANFFAAGKGVVAIDSAVTYLAYSGFMWPSAAGTNGIATYWEYSSSTNDQLILVSHDITEDYIVGDVYSSVGGDASMFDSMLPGDALALTGSSFDSSRVYVAAREDPSGGRVVELGPFAVSSVPADLHEMVRDAVSWAASAAPVDHDIVVLGLQAPDFLRPGDTTLVGATIRNRGLNNETNVQVNFTVDGVVLANTTIPFLGNGTSTTVSFPWTPSVEANYTVCIEVQPVPDENVTTNNVRCRVVIVRAVSGFILFDQTHGTLVLASHSIWADALTAEGYVVDTLTSTPIVTGVLAGYDIFVIPEPQSSYLASELAAIQAFVAAGGGLLVIGDDQPFIFDQLTSFADIGWISGRASGTTSDITPHEVTEGVSSVLFRLALSQLTVGPNALSLIRVSGQHMLVVSETPGRVAGIGDEQVFVDPDILSADNLLLAMNLMGWLLGVQLEHDVVVVNLQAPAYLRTGTTTFINATIRNRGLNNETNVQVNFTVDGVTLDNTVIPFLEIGTSTVVSFSWTASVPGGTYRVGIETAPVPGEDVTTNNKRTLDVLVSSGPASGRLALISDSTELQLLTPMLDALGVAYDVLDDNDFSRHTEDLALLLQYEAMVYYTHFGMSISELETLEGYAQLGGKLVVTGLDSLIGFSPLADLVRSTSAGDEPFSPTFTVTDGSHPIMNGVFGSFPTGSTHDTVVADHDQVEADTTRGAETVAELPGGRDKIIVTELPSGGIVTYWNGVGSDDWLGNPNLERMFKNLLDWYLDGPLDTVAPAMSITSPLTGELFATGDVSVVWSASDPGSSIARIEVSRDGGPPEVLPASASSLTFAALPDGAHTITVTAYDLFENSRTATVDVTVDTTPPTVSIFLPLPGEAVGSRSVDVSWSVTDQTSGVDRIEVSLDGSVPLPLASTASSHTFTDVADGPHTITIRAFDMAGNEDAAIVHITVDTVKPTAVAGEDQTANAGDTVSFDASASYDDVSIASYEWDFGDGTTGTGETTTHAYTDAATYTVTLTVRDAAGNADADLLFVTIETSPGLSPSLATFAGIGVVSAAAAGAALLLWRRRAGGKEEA